MFFHWDSLYPVISRTGHSVRKGWIFYALPLVPYICLTDQAKTKMTLRIYLQLKRAIVSSFLILRIGSQCLLIMLKGPLLFILYFNGHGETIHCDVHCSLPLFPVLFSLYDNVSMHSSSTFDDKLSEFQLLIHTLFLPFLAFVFVKKILIHLIKFISLC